MNIRLQAALPDSVEVGTYEAEYKPCIDESIVLSLDADREQSIFPSLVRFRVVDVVHIAFNKSQIEPWMHPWHEKQAQLLVLVEPADEHARNYLTRLISANLKERGYAVNKQHA